MKRQWNALRPLAVILALALAAAAPGTASGQMRGRLAVFGKEPLTIESASAKHRFTVEIARTGRQHSQGLMYRRKLAADAGMLFIYRRVQPVVMWMKNTYIPLDMLFIAGDGRIVTIVERAVPFSVENISSERPVLAVLELNAGTASRLKLKVGDRVVSASLRNYTKAVRP